MTLLLMLSMLALSACKSSKEKAAEYYQSALSYMEKGDTPRALVELRNVFKYDGTNKDARKLYADTVLAQGNVSEAYSQYLRLIEQYPNMLDVRLILTRLAMRSGNWDEVQRHGEAAIQLAPDDPRVQAVASALDYRKAMLASDKAAAAKASARAEALLKDHPDDIVARRVAIDAHLKGSDPISALPLIEAAIKQDPTATDYRVMQFRLLAQAGRNAEAGKALAAAYEQAPENTQLRDTLVSWYVHQGDTDRAEALLRKIAGPDTGAPDGHVALVRFLAQARGADAARAELDRLIAANAGSDSGKELQRLYRGMKAELQFQSGDHAGAIAAMREALKAAPDSDQTRTMKVSLAQMLTTTGDQVGARNLVEKVLSQDPSQVTALKMRANWLIRADKPDAAIVDLRNALNGAPQDVGLMMMMAQAHLRAGDRDLAGERLALAAQTSDYAPQVALPYARFLLQDKKQHSANTVLTLSYKRNPDNLDVIAALANLAMQQQAWGQAQDLLDQLDKIGSDKARTMAGQLRAAMLLGQNRTAEGLQALQQQFASTGDDQSMVLLVMTHLRNGETDQARSAVETALKAQPKAPKLRLLQAIVDVVANDKAKAEAELRALIADQPQMQQPVQMLASLLIAARQDAAAAKVLDDAIARQKSPITLQSIRAGLYEKSGNIDAAIKTYEAIYAENSGDVTNANNLASMLADYRDDDASLARATALGQRLRELPQPPFQDTWGWILYRQGKLQEALQPLQAAVAGLPENALVQAHVGLDLAALNRGAEARPHLQKALQLAGSGKLAHRAEVEAALAKIADGDSGSGSTRAGSTPDSGATSETLPAPTSN